MHHLFCTQWHIKDMFFEFFQVFLEEQAEWFSVSARPRAGDYSLCFPAVLRMNFVSRAVALNDAGVLYCAVQPRCLVHLMSHDLLQLFRNGTPAHIAFAMCVLDCLAAVSCLEASCF